MPYCRSCGASIKSGVKFCTSCGAPVRVPAKAPVRAPVRAPVKKPEAPAREAPVEKPVAVPPPRKLEMPRYLLPIVAVVVVVVVVGAVAAVLLRGDSRIQDLGDFKVAYGAAQSPACQKWAQAFQTSKGFEQLADALNQTLALPRDVSIVLAETGQVNAWYDLSKYEIVITYDLMVHFEQLFSGYTEPDTRVVHTTLFIFFHELGHGLIHVYNLPITGKEEDAVDQLSVLILLSAGEEGETAAINGANSFYLMSQQPDRPQTPFWDTHSLDQQRFYNILAWVYGSNPQKFSWLVPDYLPQERAVYAQGEYQTMYRAWETLLSPYVK